MADGAINSLSATLSSQTLSMNESSSNPAPPTTDILSHTHPLPATGPSDPNMSTEQPAKRRPGRPKGSGKKSVDLTVQVMKPKRPVGRPRKDGLPPGSVVEKKTRPRKRPPGNFATLSGANGQAPGLIPYGVPPFPQWHASLSVPPMPSMGGQAPPPMFPIDPNLDRDNWVDLSRNRPDLFLHSLVTALSVPNPASTVGPSVEEAFRAHLGSLVPGSKNTNIPTLYSVLKTFWLPCSPTYFSLTSSASSARTPSEHRFLYWDPQLLIFNGIACPACGTALINKGRIASGPVKVYDLGKPFFIIGSEYVCRSPGCLPPGTQGEGRKFASTDFSILRALPPKLKDEFPARLLVNTGPVPDFGTGPDVWSWRSMGVSTSLWNMVRAALRTGLQKDAIMGIVQAINDGLPDEPWFIQPPPAMPPPPPPQAKKPEEAGIVAGEGDEADAEGGAEEEEEEEDGNGDVNKETTAQEFQEAWNTNNGAQPNGAPPDTGAASAGAGVPNDPSGPSQQAMSAPVGPPPPDYTHGFPQHPYLPYGYPPYAYYPPPHLPPQSASAFKRTFSVVDGADDAPLSGPVHKRVRHCVKCGSSECKGKGGRSFCQNKCQDCGKQDCLGRNSKKPDRTCTDAWT